MIIDKNAWYQLLNALGDIAEEHYSLYKMKIVTVADEINVLTENMGVCYSASLKLDKPGLSQKQLNRMLVKIKESDENMEIDGYSCVIAFDSRESVAREVKDNALTIIYEMLDQYKKASKSVKDSIRNYNTAPIAIVNSSVNSGPCNSSSTIKTNNSTCKIDNVSPRSINATSPAFK